MTDYDLAFGFWRLLAQSYTPIGESRALVNGDAPFVLSNALWYPNPDAIRETHAFYAEQGVCGSCVLETTPGARLQASLEVAGLAHTARYGLFPVTSVNTAKRIAVEQVSWAQTRALGEVTAKVYDLRLYAVAVGQTLALALQLEDRLGAFVAYDGALDDEAVGAMVTLETSEKVIAFVLEALSLKAEHALKARMSFEAQTRNKEALVFAKSETGGLELWQPRC